MSPLGGIGPASYLLNELMHVSSMAAFTTLCRV